jgi:hypothetical protein
MPVCNRRGYEHTMTGEGWSHRFRPRPKGPLGLTEKNFPVGQYFFRWLFFWEIGYPN